MIRGMLVWSWERLLQEVLRKMEVICLQITTSFDKKRYWVAKEESGMRLMISNFPLDWDENLDLSISQLYIYIYIIYIEILK